MIFATREHQAVKKVGLIGGTSWHSTMEYYAGINRAINEWHGDNTNPPLFLANLNQKEIHDLQRLGDWDGIAALFVDAAKTLELTGVDGISLCASTPHKIHGALVDAVDVPVLHIADAIAMTLKQNDWRKVGLIGTRFTMEEDFIKGRLRSAHQVETVVPGAAVRGEIQDLIYDRLSVGVFEDAARAFVLDVVEALANDGAQAVILGCTEFPLLLKDTRCETPLVDSLKSHCEWIVQFILGDAGLTRNVEG